MADPITQLAFVVMFSFVFCLAVLGRDIVRLVIGIIHETRVREVRVTHVHKYEGMKVTISPNAAGCASSWTDYSFEYLNAMGRLQAWV